MEKIADKNLTGIVFFLVLSNVAPTRPVEPNSAAVSTATEKIMALFIKGDKVSLSFILLDDLLGQKMTITAKKGWRVEKTKAFRYRSYPNDAQKVTPSQASEKFRAWAQNQILNARSGFRYFNETLSQLNEELILMGISPIEISINVTFKDDG